MKRWISMIVVVLMVTMIIPAMSFSASALEDGSYVYEMVDEDTVEITSFKSLTVADKQKQDTQQAADAATVVTDALVAEDPAATDETAEGDEAATEDAASQENEIASVVAIPSKLDGHEVVSIARNAFKERYYPKKFVIPDTVTTIGREAFAGCPALKTVYIPDSVTTIERGAFKMCKKLSSVTIPDSITTIEKETFFACSGLNTITIPDSVTEISKSAFTGCNEKMTIIANEGSYAHQFALDNDLRFQKYETFFEANQTVLLIVGGAVLLVVLIVGAYVGVKKFQTKKMKDEFAQDRAQREANK